MKGLGDLLKQAQALQSQMAGMKDELAQLSVTGESGAGLVRIEMNGAHEVRRVHIDDSLVNEDKAVLEDLIAAAMNDAARRVQDAVAAENDGAGEQHGPATRHETAVLKAFSPLLARLIDAFQVLPGVGPKTAQRMALHLLQRDREGGRQLAGALADSMDQVGYCERCRTFCETTLCDLCTDPQRDPERLCVVESAADILAIEAAGGFRGTYFVLHGRLSPIDGVGPEQLGIDRLASRAADDAGLQEVILATNPTVEGEATAHYLSELLKPHVACVSRIAHGVPLGGELEYIDGGTIVHALRGRRTIS